MLSLPVLALNQVYTAVKPTNLYQILPGAGGRGYHSVADKAWAEGHRKAAVLYPK